MLFARHWPFPASLSRTAPPTTMREDRAAADSFSGEISRMAARLGSCYVDAALSCAVSNNSGVQSRISARCFGSKSLCGRSTFPPMSEIALDRRDSGASHWDGEHQTPAHDLSVDPHRARTAPPCSAAQLMPVSARSSRRNQPCSLARANGCRERLAVHDQVRNEIVVS